LVLSFEGDDRIFKQVGMVHHQLTQFFVKSVQVRQLDEHCQGGSGEVGVSFNQKPERSGVFRYDIGDVHVILRHERKACESLANTER